MNTVESTATAATETTAENILGGVTENTPVAETPGKAARKRANAKTNTDSAEKREYTPRGTTYFCKRVVLKDGKPVGRGRPSEEELKGRMVVYIPKDAEYDEATYGKGVKYNTATHSAPFKRISKKSVSWVFDDGIEPTAPKVKKAKAVKAAKPAKKAAKPAKKAVKKVKKDKTVTVPVEPAAPATDATDAVTAPVAEAVNA
jgi:hypothetical protein